MTPFLADAENSIHTGEWIIIVLTVVGIVIALNAIVVVILMEWLKTRIETIKNEDVRFARKHELILYSIQAIERFDSTIETHLAVQAGIVSALAEKANLNSEFPFLEQENKVLQDAVRRALQEAFIASEIERRRFAAIQELSNSVGDGQSLQRMRDMAQHFPNDHSFARGIEHLENRLNAYRGLETH